MAIEPLGCSRCGYVQSVNLDVDCLGINGLSVDKGPGSRRKLQKQPFFSVLYVL